MRIFVDGRHGDTGRGVARYARALLAEMTARFDDDWQLVDRGRALNASSALLRRPRLGAGADVAWLPAPMPVAVAPGVPYVLTVHDLSWVVRPSDFTVYERAWHRLGRLQHLAQRAALVIAVSEATRAEVVARWGIAADRVRVVRSGPGMEGVRNVDPAVPEERSGPLYFLAVGALEPRKEPVLLARAHARARAAGLRAELWFAGAGRLTRAVAGDGVRVLGSQDDAALHELYANALAVAHPARLEGFGFPPIEALAHGSAPVVADIPVYDETVRDGALRFPPGDEAALAEALLTLERDEALRARLVGTGRAAIAGLSWPRAAEETHAVLKEAAC